MSVFGKGERRKREEGIKSQHRNWLRRRFLWFEAVC
jgi:hypothetical protein